MSANSDKVKDDSILGTLRLQSRHEETSKLIGRGSRLLRRPFRGGSATSPAVPRKGNYDHRCGTVRSHYKVELANSIYCLRYYYSGIHKTKIKRNAVLIAAAKVVQCKCLSTRKNDVKYKSSNARIYRKLRHKPMIGHSVTHRREFGPSDGSLLNTTDPTPVRQ